MVVIHGDAKEDVGGFHGLAVVSDDDELRLGAEVFEDGSEAAGIGVVEGGVNFVEDDEGAGIDAQDGGQQSHAGQSALAAGEGLQAGKPFAPG